MTTLMENEGILRAMAQALIDERTISGEKITSLWRKTRVRARESADPEQSPSA